MFESTDTQARELGAAIAEAGYTPVPLEAPVVVAGPTKARAGGCCGCC